MLYKTGNCLGFLQQENKQLWRGSDTVRVVSVKRGKDAQLKGPGAFGFCSVCGWMDSQRDGYCTVAVLSQLWIFRTSMSALCQLFPVKKRSVSR